ncbi:UDP-N-acetylmuramoyl-L-alanyl-D-glutamate--2,6-diaminopimelate ligase [Persephonella sp. KM09-Lau-8]|uniref:UDP-N-acetylmuramoyl-L-alanyl-D-glutamate--2, 6-diaminopimelate ligase n=1 Tax=Persephonella sp. KM09-Lau-8 TaxID=1158345 RepID=UPI00069061C7|nr:UDP-N-acetylmuramoyl-L-alanyl-D-glutamate--2,6-diaminopimelate ligase [Persephonella sp. KM09-Lau-8]
MEKKLKEIFEEKQIFHKGNDKPVLSLENNSRNVKEGSVFFAIKGTTADGHKFISDAIKKGATTIVVQDKNIAQSLKNEYPQINIILVENTRITQAETARKFYGYPDKKLKIIGITGTNGKTTTSHIIAQFLEAYGKKTGIIGTTGYKIGDKVISEGRTTPDAIQWFSLLDRFRKEGAEFVVAEISSHALDQYRVYGTEFDAAVFTNLSHDHLDYHKTLEEYFLAKRRLFEQLSPEKPAVINADDNHGKRLIKEFPNTVSYGKNPQADLKILDYKQCQSQTCIDFEYKGKRFSIKTSLLGDFNVYNMAAALLTLIKLGMPIEFFIEKALSIKPVRGRFEVVEENGIKVIIDYAHTPDALENVLKSINKIKEKRVITVFGAGGDRDREKRPLMGKVAQRLSDIVIITSDNPRSEDPMDIIRDIKTGLTSEKNIFVEIDREKAIEKAINMAEKGDIILIAGKGHETYQIIGNKTVHFDDKEVAEKYLKKAAAQATAQEKC